MSRIGLFGVLPLCIVLTIADRLSADIILNSMAASVSASIAPGSPLTGSSIATSGTLTRTSIGTSNNFTTSSENYGWNSLSLVLSGQSLITEAKTVSAGAGRAHLGLSSLTFNFSTTSPVNFTSRGRYGFTNDTASFPDSVAWSLVGPSTNFSQSALAGGGDSQVFFQSGQLGVGTYTFTITARLEERINNTSSRTAKWSLTMFSVQPLTAIPEFSIAPAMYLIFAIICVAGILRERQPREPAFAYARSRRQS